MATVSITGFKEIDSVLKKLPLEVTHQVLGQAHLAAAKPLIEKEKLLAPEGPTGNLIDSIGGVKASFKRATEVGLVTVGPLGRKGAAGHLVEFGTKKRRTRKGANRGIMPKKPFAQPAFDQTKGLVESNIANALAQSMAKRMRKELGSAYVRG